MRNIFPETTIVRPAPMYGYEDRLLNKLADTKNLFTANHLQQTFWPVHVSHVTKPTITVLSSNFVIVKVVDVATGLEAMVNDDDTASETFELYGPKQYSMAEVAEVVDKEIVKHRRHINLPKFFLKNMAWLLNRAIWWPTVSADQVDREFIDQEIDAAAKTFKDLGIEPAQLTGLTYQYLVGLPKESLSWFMFKR